MLFTKALTHFLILGAAAARAIQGQPENSISLEKNDGSINAQNVDIAAAKDPVLAPTSTTPTIKIGRSAAAADAPSPTQSGLISTCDAYYFVESGESCSGIVSKFGNFTLDQFYTWNPAVKSDCSNLLAGYYVCIGVAGTSSTTTSTSIVPPTTTSTSVSVPAPTQTGIASNCDLYYEVVSGDTCIGIANNYKITLANFYSWNPAVGSNCETLLAGYYVCVGVSGAKKRSLKNIEDLALLKRVDPTAVTTTTTTPTSTAPLTPSPTQPGIVSGCKNYYQAQPGDTCISIVTNRFPNISLSQFESWNPAVGPNCNSLLAGYYYCVAV